MSSVMVGRPWGQSSRKESWEEGEVGEVERAGRVDGVVVAVVVVSVREGWECWWREGRG